MKDENIPHTIWGSVVVIILLALIALFITDINATRTIRLTAQAECITHGGTYIQQGDYGTICINPSAQE